MVRLPDLGEQLAPHKVFYREAEEYWESLRNSSVNKTLGMMENKISGH